MESRECSQYYVARNGHYLRTTDIVNAEGKRIVVDFSGIVSVLVNNLKFLPAYVQIQFNSLDYLISEIDLYLYNISPGAHSGTQILIDAGVPSDMANEFTYEFRSRLSQLLDKFIDSDDMGTVVMSWVPGTMAATLKMETTIPRATYLAFKNRK